jgi:predicted phosphodiesterase
MTGNRTPRVAVLCDIHANLPALEAVLAEVRAAGAGLVVVGGDVLPGPMPREALALLLGLDIPVRFIVGNGELAVLAQIAAAGLDSVTYWGTTSGKPLPEPQRRVLRWTADQLHPQYDDVLRNWPKTLRVEVDGLGPVLVCHGTPRSEVEVFTGLTPEHLLAPVFQGLDVALVACGHTHMPFDRTIAGVRVVNAGSVGMPFGRPGADWALLGPTVELRHTTYDLQRAAARIRQTGYPEADQFAAQNVLNPPSEAAMLEVFTHASFR